MILCSHEATTAYRPYFVITYEEITAPILENGVYFLKNKQTARYADIENQNFAEGTYIHQWDFHGFNTQKWIIKYTHKDNYYTIRIAYYSPYHYLSVKNDSMASSARTILRTGTDENNITTITDGMLWGISTTASGAYKIRAITGEANDRVLSLGWYLINVNGIDIDQCDYHEDNNYSDEWFIEFDETTDFIRAPDKDAQNKTCWCWVACSKKVGAHNGQNNPLNVGASLLDNTAGLHSYNGTLFYGETTLHHYSADMGQRRIVVGIFGNDENHSGSNADKESALQSASKNTMVIGTLGNGSLSTSQIDAMKSDLSNNLWVVGNIFSGSLGHSIVITGYDAATDMFSFWDPWTNTNFSFSGTSLQNDTILMPNSQTNYCLKYVQYCRN